MIGALIIKRKVPESMAALERHDLDALLKDWADDAVLEYPGDIPEISGTHSGIEAIRAFYRRDFEQFPELEITPTHIAVTNLFDFTGNNVAIVSWDADVTNKKGFSLKNKGVSVMQIRQGKIRRVRTFIFDTGEIFRKAWT